MSEINNGGLDQYGTEPFEQQQFGTAGVEGVKVAQTLSIVTLSDLEQSNGRRYALFYTVRQISEPTASNALQKCTKGL